MKKLSFLICSAVLLAVLATFSSCKKVSGEGPIVTETRGLSGFTTIHTEISADVYFTPGATYSVAIEAQLNIINAIETVIKDSKLEVRVESGTHLKSGERIKIYVTAPGITALALNGSGNIFVTNDFPTTNLDLRVKGSGSISVPKLDAASLTADISGSGNITISAGDVSHEDLEISGSGDMDLAGLKAKEAEATIGGSGNIRLFATEKLKVRITGSGNVYYKGTPSIDVNITGSGSLKNI